MEWKHKKLVKDMSNIGAHGYRIQVSIVALDTWVFWKTKTLSTLTRTQNLTNTHGTRSDVCIEGLQVFAWEGIQG